MSLLTANHVTELDQVNAIWYCLMSVKISYRKMKLIIVWFISFSSIFLPKLNCAILCKTEPSDVIGPRSNEEKFSIEIQGKPHSYTPEQVYNVTLKAINPDIAQTFKKFSLRLQTSTHQPAGHFYIGKQDELLAKFSTSCPSTVVESSSFPKTDIQVFWIAPPQGSGCVSILGTVIISEEKWYGETGPLNRTLCEDEEFIDENIQPEKMKKCCACSEAKYEVAFEGRWTKNTHPKGFPKNIWETKFSDIIGASHQPYRSFWYEKSEPSLGLQMLAYNGSTEGLQSELINDQSRFIRTLIKAKGLRHPDLTESSYSVFRVDKDNHRVSLVSKIIPSPDWIVGVSDFELCTVNGSWIDFYTYNLYPFDVGIDSGKGYTDSEPRAKGDREPIITAITQYNPNDNDSPFFSEIGEPLNPLARVHFRKQRVYDRECDSDCQEIQEKTEIPERR